MTQPGSSCSSPAAPAVSARVWSTLLFGDPKPAFFYVTPRVQRHAWTRVAMGTNEHAARWRYVWNRFGYGICLATIAFCRLAVRIKEPRRVLVFNEQRSGCSGRVMLQLSNPVERRRIHSPRTFKRIYERSLSKGTMQDKISSAVVRVGGILFGCKAPVNMYCNKHVRMSWACKNGYVYDTVC